MLKANILLSACLLLPCVSFAENENEVVGKIDELLKARWKAEKISPARIANSADFIRRLYLDIAGRIPPIEVAQEFLYSRDPAKKANYIDRIVKTPDYAEHWANVWADILIGPELMQPMVNRQALIEWLDGQLRKNTPFDQVVRELLTSEGYSDENGATNYFMKFKMPSEAAASVSRIFLGVQIQCAQCHNHPYEKWTQDDFNGFQAFFAKTRPRRDQMAGKDMRPRFMVTEVKFAPQRMMERMGMKDAGAPKYLGGNKLDLGPVAKLRPVLAAWLTDKSNPYFARAVVNRYWGILNGRGIVHPLDDFGKNNLPSHPEILDILAKDFVDNGYDVRRLLRILTSTYAYQASSRVPTPHRENPPPDDLFAYQQLKPLSAEQIVMSIFEATRLRDAKNRQITGAIKTRARAVVSLFNFTFDTDGMEEVSGFEGTIPQALLMLNGPLTNETLRPIPGTTLGEIAASKESVDKKLDTLFLSTLTRLPDANDRIYFKRYLRDEGYKPEAWADVQWTLLNTSEFLFVN